MRPGGQGARPGGTTGPDGTLVYRLRGVHKAFGGPQAPVHALRGVDLDVTRSRFTAVMGASGSGKSTLLHVMSGLVRPDTGTVELDGADLTTMDDDALTDLRRTGLGLVFQGSNLLTELSARDNVLLPTHLARRPPGNEWWARLRADLGLDELLDRQVSSLSGGQQQRVALARALIASPRAVLADEPTGNLDQSASTEVLALLRTCTRELGQSVVMVTHDPASAAYADTVLLLADGRVAGRVDDPTPASVAAGLQALRDGL